MSKKGCTEYHQISRRRFLGLSAGALAGAAAASSLPSWLPRLSFAASENSSRDIIVSIFLRGGADALTLCVPHAEDAYYALRPTLAVPRPDSSSPHRAVDLDGFFGFPQGMAALRDAYLDKKLLVVHGCGSKDPTRSHFSAMYFMEVGQPSPPASLFTGWLGRHLQSTTPARADAVLRAVGVGYGLPRTLVGAPATVPVRDLAGVGFNGSEETLAEREQALRALYATAADASMRSSAETTLKTVELLGRIDFDSYHPAGGAAYPDDEFGYALRSTAALLKSDVGIEAAGIDFGGWDTHDEEGPLDGHLHEQMQSLSGGLAAFHKDIFSAGNRNVVVVVQSEFGRNVAENASGGTDHGHGGLMLVMGNHIAGGRVLRQWPGLGEDQLYEGQDLAITIDYRDILTEIVQERLGNPNLRAVFPDPAYTPVRHGVTV
jgi:uncharacterized protein (DUF1501 family)